MSNNKKKVKKNDFIGKDINKPTAEGEKDAADEPEEDGPSGQLRSDKTNITQLMDFFIL